MIAALYVSRKGPYWNQPGIDAWDEERDARLYKGPWPVVAHPPCARWGRYWHGGPSAKTRQILGDDEGCFEAAFRSVQAFGGVLEHPEASHAWKAFGLNKPPRSGGWVNADHYGVTCCVEQGHYGHRARKATWLYAVGTDLPEFIWGPSKGEPGLIDAGYHSAEERAAAKINGNLKSGGRMSKVERMLTPEPFAKLLISMARSV